MAKPTKPSGTSGILRAAGLVSAISVDLAVCVLAGFFGGKWISRVTGWGELPIVLGFLLGVAAGILSMIWMIKYIMEGSDE